jgi:hypothetical protein
LEEVGDKKEATSAGRGYTAFEQGGHLMIETVAGDNHLARFACTVENLDLLFGQEARRERGGDQRFFLPRP